jgi:DNA topoisomerase-1
LFQYVDDAGQQHAIGSADVNQYLHTLTGEDCTARDFRTWSGTGVPAGTIAAETCKDTQANVDVNGQ